MDTLITYDIKADASGSKDTAVKNGMKEKKYLDHFTCTDAKKVQTKYNLPNTTLWRKNTEPSIAKADLLAVAKSCSAEVERLIAVEFTDNWAAIPGKPYASK